MKVDEFHTHIIIFKGSQRKELINIIISIDFIRKTTADIIYHDSEDVIHQKKCI